MMSSDTDLSTTRLADGDLAFGPDDGSELAHDGALLDLTQVFDVPVTLSAILGHARVPVAELLKISPGSIFELDRRTGEAIDILINDRLVARGEVVLVEDRLGVTMTEIVRPAL